MSNKGSALSRFVNKLLTVGPGIFAIGYTIGTGSVTSMIVAGSRFGMQLLWVLLLSCLFSWVMMEAYGRYCLVTAQTALYGFRKNFKYGKWIAILIIIGVSFGQWNSLIGIMGISSNIIFETLSLFIPSIKGYEYIVVLMIAIGIISIFYLLLLLKGYTFFEKVLLFFVTMMGLSFLISNFILLPDPAEIVGGLVPSIPAVGGGKMLVAAFVGTTMASATFLSRPLFIKGKGWTMDNYRDQQKDALVAAIFIFTISAAIMTIAASALYHDGKTVEKVLDMVYALEPIAGKWAIAIFFLGALSAGLSSIFPILMITPIMIADYQQGTLDTKSKQFRMIAAIACLVGLTDPLFGLNPINSQIATQVFNVFVLPLVIICMMILINKKNIMGEYRAGILLNLGMSFALLFAFVISYNGLLALINNG